MLLAARTQHIILVGMIMVITLLCLPAPTIAASNDYPKLANVFTTWDIVDSQIPTLAQWDVLVLAPQILDTHPAILTDLKQLNPDIVLLAYIPSQEINHDVAPALAADSLWGAIYKTADSNNWWLRNGSGDHVYWWPGTWMINASSTAPRTGGENFSEFLPRLVSEKLLYPGSPWDGVFYDNLWDNITWIQGGVIDINGDGSNDAASYINQKWTEGMDYVIQRTEALAPDKIVVGNTSTNSFNPLTNGRLHENFPLPHEGGWEGGVKNYINHNIGKTPKIFIINRTTNNTYAPDDYRSFRFGLTTTLLGDGYYSFDFGDQAHSSTWWYDEYSISLGQPVSQLKNVFDLSSTEIEPGVWRRDFTNGIVLVNSTSETKKITLTEELEKIKGKQDPAVNNGSLVRTIILAPQDGVVLIRRLDILTDAVYANGSFVRVYDKFGESVRNGFFTRHPNFSGNVMIEQKDIDADGVQELIIADDSKISIYTSAGSFVREFYPYGKTYKNGINFNVDDFDNDGYMEIVTGTGKGAAPLVKTFNYTGEEITKGFYAYSQNFRGGVNVTICDLNGNGKKQVVTGAGYFGGPQVRIFEKDGRVLSGGFFAYGKEFRGGVYVQCGDIDGNGNDEIITGAGVGGSTHVLMFDGKTRKLNPGFFAFSKTSRTGVRVFVNDLDGDGIEEILAEAPNLYETAF